MTDNSNEHNNSNDNNSNEQSDSTMSPLEMDIIDRGVLHQKHKVTHEKHARMTKADLYEFVR